MPSFVAVNRFRLRYRHYVRQATAPNHWFDFTEARVHRLEQLHGDDFCLVINGSNETDDAYVLPYRVAKQVFNPKYLDERRRWIGTVVGDRLKLGKADRSFPVAEFHNAFERLK